MQIRGERKVSEISPGGIGLFGANARRLEQLGLMTEVKQIPFEETKLYMGKFKGSLTLQEFLSNPKLQLKVFSLNMKDYKEQIEKGPLKKFIGKTIDGEEITLSGLLGLAHQAGIKGAMKWLKKAKDREKFPHTTEMFYQTNGLF